MTFRLVDQGEEDWLDLILAINYTLRLYTNDVTSGLTEAQIEALTESDFTEATFAGYSAKTLTGGSWTTTPDDPSTGTYAQQTFTRSSTGTAELVYGYYYERASDGALQGFEDFGGALSIEFINDSIAVTPTITLDDDQEATVAARGMIDEQVETSASSLYSTSQNTDMVLSSVPADSGRSYRIHVQSPWNVNGVGEWFMLLTEDGTNIARIGYLESTSGLTEAVLCASFLWEPTTTGTYTLRIYASEYAGTATVQLYATTTAPRQFWVEDCGPRP